MNHSNLKSTNLIFVIITVLAFLLGDRAFALYEEALRPPNAQMQEAVIFVFQTLPGDLSAHPFAFSLSRNALLAGAISTGAVLCVWLYYIAGNGTRRPGEEYGSTRWGTLREAQRFANRKNETQNIILSKHIRMTTERPRRFELDRNLNVTAVQWKLRLHGPKINATSAVGTELPRPRLSGHHVQHHGVCVVHALQSPLLHRERG